ncbi:hypothetical protein ABE096_21570 [Robertmurraya massiliosenegalensis]|uniref:hypothetical protein n=1 Tax=Robertmurraya TaxID=2837507 RepID=UPI0039A41E0C
MKKKLFTSLAVVFSLFLMFTVSTLASEGDSKNSTEYGVAAVPTAIFTIPTNPIIGGSQYPFKVGTTSTSGPHVFYFNPGDGTTRQRYDGRGSEQSRTFYYTYKAYDYSKPYSATAQTADQLNISSLVTKTVIVNAW